MLTQEIQKTLFLQTKQMREKKTGRGGNKKKGERERTEGKE